MTMQKFIRRFGFFEYGGILLLFVAVAVAYVLLSPQSKDILITVRLAEKDLIWLDNGSPRAFGANVVHPGMKDKDALGRVTAEVTEVIAFDQPRQESPYVDKKTVYVTLRLRASHTTKTDQYRYQGTLLQVGEWVRFSINSTTINGLVISTPSSDIPKPVWVTVKAQLKPDDLFGREPFDETTGVDWYIAQAITVGDKATDSEGHIIAQILEKQVVPATRTTFDLNGNIYQRNHPRKFDVYITAKVAALRVNDELYYLDALRMKVNARLPLFLSRIDIEPRITEIVSVNEQ